MDFEESYKSAVEVLQLLNRLDAKMTAKQALAAAAIKKQLEDLKKDLIAEHYRVQLMKLREEQNGQE